MFNYYYLNKIRKDKTKLTPPKLMIYYFNQDLTDKDKLWLLFEEYILINNNSIDLDFEENLKNIILASNKTISEQIIRVLYNNDYNPFVDKINLEWFNDSQKKYIKKIHNTLIEIKDAIANVLLCETEKQLLVISEYHSKDINIKDIFFEYEIDILFTYETNDSIVKIYFNPYTISKIQPLIDKIKTKYIVNFIQESNSIEIKDDKITTLDIFDLLVDKKTMPKRRFLNSYKNKKEVN